MKTDKTLQAVHNRRQATCEFSSSARGSGGRSIGAFLVTSHIVYIGELWAKSEDCLYRQRVLRSGRVVIRGVRVVVLDILWLEYQINTSAVL